jgi:hypothetical protein
MFCEDELPNPSFRNEDIALKMLRESKKSKEVLPSSGLQKPMSSLKNPNNGIQIRDTQENPKSKNYSVLYEEIMKVI